MKQRTVNCPQCGKSVIWSQANRFRPFCSERCKTMDLAQWAQESYRIPEPEQSTTENDEPVPNKN
ncbi:DNA gyrase inhibitor YacG [Nitrosomonas marina]|uniref:DNA gyrase inhibitor YacG n=1 Tax=Nitrosomonas marina TaxID=917 RepID=UPI000A8E94CB|nr:DNA gyrase inhibitor YacG [Nitrosomonas marina]